MPCSSRPPERLTFSARMRRVTVSIDRPSCASFCWSTKHLHLVFVAAADLDRGRTFDRLEVRLQPVLGEAPQRLEPVDAVVAPACRPSSRNARRMHGLARRVEAQQQRPLGLERQLQQVELLAHVDAGEVHVRAPDELERHVRLAGARDRAHLAHVADDADRFLDRPRDQRLEFERRRAGQLGADRERRIGEVGQQVQLEARQRHEAEQRDGDRAHDDRSRAGGSRNRSAAWSPRPRAAARRPSPYLAFALSVAARCRLAPRRRRP